MTAIYLLGGDVADPPIDWSKVAEIDIRNLYAKRIISDDIYLARFEEHHPWLYKLWLYSCDCGRSLSQWVACSVSIVFAFGLLFNYCKLLDWSNSAEPCILRAIYMLVFGNSLEPGFWQAIHFSFVTFMTFGSEDINVTQGWGQRIADAEMVFGYVMLGILIAIFATKIARRS